MGEITIIHQYGYVYPYRHTCQIAYGGVHYWTAGKIELLSYDGYTVERDDVVISAAPPDTIPLKGTKYNSCFHKNFKGKVNMILDPEDVLRISAPSRNGWLNGAVNNRTGRLVNVVGTTKYVPPGERLVFYGEWRWSRQFKVYVKYDYEFQLFGHSLVQTHIERWSKSKDGSNSKLLYKAVNRSDFTVSKGKIHQYWSTDTEISAGFTAPYPPGSTSGEIITPLIHNAAYNTHRCLHCGWSGELPEMTYLSLIERFWDKADYVFGLLESAERHSDSSLIRKAAKSIEPNMNNLEYAQGLKELTELNKAIKDIIKKASKLSTLLKAVSGGYLLYKYGLSTTKRDTKKILDNADTFIGEFLNQGAINRHATAWTTLLVNEVTVQLEEVGTVIAAPVLTGLKSAHHELKKLGLSASANNLWELVPFSFVIDWFIDISGYMDYLVDNVYYSRHFWTDVVCFSSSKASISVANLNDPLFSGSATFSLYERSASNGFPLFECEVGSNEASDHVLEMGALIIGNFTKP